MEGFAAWAARVDTGEFWIFTGVLAAIAIAGFIAGFHFLRRARLFEDIPTSRIRSAAQGYVEFDGYARVMEGPEILGGLTGLPCVWWEYKIERKETTGSGKNRRTYWRTIARAVSECLFAIDDDTGTCVIDPEGASVTTRGYDRWYGSQSRWAGPPPESGWRRWFGGRYRFTERRLDRNRPLYSIGWFRTIGGAGDDFDTNEEVRRLLVEWKRDQAALIERFDTDGDGGIDMDEWEAARRAAEDEVREEQLKRALRPGVNVLGLPPARIGRPFVLSAIPQEKLIRRCRLKAAGSLAAFFLCGGSTVALVGARIAAGL